MGSNRTLILECPTYHVSGTSPPKKKKVMNAFLDEVQPLSLSLDKAILERFSMDPASSMGSAWELLCCSILQSVLKGKSEMMSIGKSFPDGFYGQICNARLYLYKTLIWGKF